MAESQVNERSLDDQPEAIDVDLKFRICKSVVKINLASGSGTGFFYMLPNDNEACYGLVTNNHVLNEKLISKGNPVECEFNGTSHLIPIADSYSFTCKEPLDVTFIQISADHRKQIRDKGGVFVTSLPYASPVERGDTILIFQHPGGRRMKDASGTMRKAIGAVDFGHNAATDKGSSGSPVFDRSGNVIGVHKKWDESSKLNVAVRMECVVKAILSDMEGGAQSDESLASAVAMCAMDTKGEISVENGEMVDLMIKDGYIQTSTVEEVFRRVDRGAYFPPGPENRKTAYKNQAWKQGNVHLSAPNIYAVVVEALEIEPGMSFLNMGSGTGYLSTVVGLLIGAKGTNHGVEYHQDVVDYAKPRLEAFKKTLGRTAFCPPTFFRGNCLKMNVMGRYDRVYCAAQCPTEFESYVKYLLNEGGIAVMPLDNKLLQVTRKSEAAWNTVELLGVSFAPLILPTANDVVLKLALP